MTADIDLRPLAGEDRRRRLVSALDDLDPDESVTVDAEDDVDVLLHQYQFEHGERLQWDGDGSAGDGNAGDENDAGNDDDTQVVTVTKGDPLADDGLVEFDVRDMPPQRRHEVLLETFDRLEPGQGFVLVNDHDPRPLYHELRSTRGDVLDWEDRNRDPAEWTVAIEKTGESEPLGEDVAARFDVREIPKAERHGTIHHRFGNLAPGETLEIVAPHQPRNLQAEFAARYGDGYAWEVLEDDPGRCRVQVTKSSASEDGSSEGADSNLVDELSVTEELDVRDLPPAQRHEEIFDAYDALDGGEGFVLVNDHDPKPLYHQFDAEAGDEFRWEYQQKAAGEFRVLIGKANAGEESSVTPSADPEAPF